MSEDFTARFRVDISDLKKNISEANKQIRLADATFKAATAGMDDWSKDADGLSKKLDQLKSRLEAQKTILASYQQQLERQQAAYAENGNRADQLRQKLAELADKGVDKASDEYKEYEKALKAVLKEQDNNGKAVDQLRIKVLNQEAAIGKTEKELRQYDSALNSTEHEVLDLASAEDQANAATERLSAGYTVMKNVLANLITQGLRKAGRELKSLITDGAAYADEILTMSKQTGIGTDSLQKLDYMSKLVDVDTGTVAKSMAKLTKNMDSATKGSGSAYEAFMKLGVPITDVNGNLRDSEDVFNDVISVLGEYKNETERDALAMKLFGKSAQSLNPLIEAGADQIAAWNKEAVEMGYVMDEDVVKNLSELQDSFDRFKKQISAIRNQVAGGFAKAMTKGTNKLREMANAVNWKKVGEAAGKFLSKLIDGFSWIVDHGNGVMVILKGIVAAMAAAKIMQAVNAMGSFVKGLQAATVAQEGMNAAAMSNPYVLLAAAIVGVTVALVSLAKELDEAAKATDASWIRTRQLCDELDLETEKMQEVIDKTNAMIEAQDSQVSASNAQFDQTQKLADELREMADENGKVADSDKARAQFILNELNNALGTEYTMNGNIIEQYTELEQKIDDLIAKKRGLAILNAEEAAYGEALINQEDAENRLREATDARLKTQYDMAANQQRMNELYEWGGEAMKLYSDEYKNLAAQNEELQAKLDGQTEEWKEAQDAVDQYAYAIQQFQKNSEEAINKNWDAIQHKSFDAAKASGDASREASQTIIEEAEKAKTGWLKSLSEELTAITGKRVEFKEAGVGLVKAEVEGIGESAPIAVTKVSEVAVAMRDAMANGNSEYTTLGRQIPEGIAQGVNNNRDIAINAIRQLGIDMQTEYAKINESHSPSRKYAEEGENIDDGLMVGIDRKKQILLSEMSSLGSRMRESFQKGVNGLYSALGTITGSAAQDGYTGATGSTAGTSGNRNITQNYTQIINAPKQPSRIELYRQTRNWIGMARQGGNA